MREVVVLGLARTPIGNFDGALKDIPASDLGAIVIKEALKRANVKPEQVEEVILGNILQAGQGMNPSRQAALKAGIPHTTPTYLVNKVCGSGLKSVQLASLEIAAGNIDIAVAGGIENMSKSPYLLDKARNGYRMGHGTIYDIMIKDGLTCAIHDVHMGITAENVAEKYNIPRSEQDEFSCESQKRAALARAEGKFKDEIVPVEIPQRKGDPIIFADDEYIKPDCTVEKLAKLRPAFKKDGTVTAGNSSGINDGAAVVVLASADKAKELGIEPIATLVAFASAGVLPELMGMGPVDSTKKLLKKTGLTIDQIDLVEANEAFAVQSIAVAKELGLNPEKTNVNGGAIALGHPIGASGARILVTLIYELKRRGLKTGIATLCIGGGMGISVLVKAH